MAKNMRRCVVPNPNPQRKHRLAGIAAGVAWQPSKKAKARIVSKKKVKK